MTKFFAQPGVDFGGRWMAVIARQTSKEMCLSVVSHSF